MQWRGRFEECPNDIVIASEAKIPWGVDSDLV